MKIKYFKYAIFFVITLILVINLCACKKEEMVKVYFLNREDEIVHTLEVKKGSSISEYPFVQKEVGAYYKWDLEEAKVEYNLNNIIDTTWIYGDIKYVDVKYMVYYNDVLVDEKVLPYNQEYTDYPKLPENGKIIDTKYKEDYSNNTLYNKEIRITYEIVEPTYTITFYDEDEEVLEKIEYKKGDTINLPTYSKEGYVFNGWFLSKISCKEYKKIDENMSGNLCFYAKLDETIVHNKLTLQDTKYHFSGIKKVGTTIAGVYTMQPILPATANQSVSNYNWTSSNENVLAISAFSSLTAVSSGYAIITATLKSDENYIVNAVFKSTSDGIVLSSIEEANAINLCIITFKGMNDDVIAIKQVQNGGNVTYPTPLLYDGYTFVGWDKDNYNICEDITINAIYQSGIVNNYVGKSFSIIGDSISTYKNYIPDGFSCFFPYPTADVNDYNQTWWMRVINSVGGTLFLNNSYSGSCVASDTASSTYKHERLDYLNVQGQFADVCIIYMGSNDAASSTISANLFEERYKIMLDYLKEIAPDMELILFTLPVSKLYSNSRMNELNEIIKSCAESYNLKLIDLSTVDISNNLVDSAHPRSSGMELIANAIIKDMIYTK